MIEQSEASKNPEIPQELDRQEALLRQLDERIKLLINNLEPILRPITPATPREALKEITRLSPLAQILNKRNINIRDLEESIIDLIARIEL